MSRVDQPQRTPGGSVAGIAWRTLFTALSFTFFGFGALILSLLLVPLLHLVSRDRALARSRCRRAVRGGFRLFIWFMRSTGVLDYEVRGIRDIEPGTLIVANHPSLIDVIFAVAHLPDSYCVVKEALGRNPFTRLIVHATGYPTSLDPNRLIEQCTALLNAGQRIILFPEGTRTLPGTTPVFKRGAANLIVKARCATTPVFLRIDPPTLAKGEPWLKVPASKVQFTMTIGTSIPPTSLIDDSANERVSARLCNERLQAIFSDQLSNTMMDTPGIDGIDGKSADRHQGTDSQYSGT